MKITKLDKTALQNLREPLEAELVALGQRLGLKFEVGNGSYDGTGAEASFKLKITVDDPALKEAAARARWNGSCQYIGIDFNRPDETGLRPEDFGTEFVIKGTTYKTTGLAMGRTKYPVEVEVMTGPKKGQRLFFAEQAVPVIRTATDAAKAGLQGFSGFADKKRAEAARA